MAREKKRNKSSKSKSKVSLRRNKKTMRRYTRKSKGGSLLLPLRCVIPLNNYYNGDVQRDLVNARNL